MTETKVMANLQQIERDILAVGKVEGQELEVLRRRVYTGDKINCPEIDCLVELHLTPAFEQFFYKAIKDHILADGRIDAERAAWLRRTLFADGMIDDEERKFLHELNGEAKEVSPEFKVLLEENMKQPVEQRPRKVP